MSDSADRSAAEKPTLLLVTSDLFLGSRLRGLAEQAGYRVVTSTAVDRAGDVALAATGRVVIDLATPRFDVAAFVDRLPPESTKRVAAYAPHVRLDLLRAARSAGLTAVFTRGQLDTELPRWLHSDPWSP